MMRINSGVIDEAISRLRSRYRPSGISNHAKGGKDEYKVDNGADFNELKLKEEVEDTYESPQCPYCQSKAVLKASGEVYRKKYNTTVWTCPTCTDVSVGTYAGTSKPLGTLANAETRKWRQRVHQELVYQRETEEGRKQMYWWISYKLGRVKTKRPSTIATLNERECKYLIRCARKEVYDRRYRDIFLHNK